MWTHERGSSNGTAHFAFDVITLFVTRGTWKDAEFKAYNFNALGLPTNGGHLHPLLKVSISGVDYIYVNGRLF